MSDVIAVMIYIFIGIALAALFILVPSILFIDKLVKMSRRLDIPQATLLDDRPWLTRSLSKINRIKDLDDSCKSCHNTFMPERDRLCHNCKPQTTLYISGWRWTMDDELAQRLFPEYYKKN